MKLMNKATKTIRVPAIYGTTEYKKFKRITGNRKINKNHVNDLIKDIGKNNLLEQFPIVVTQDNYILDGQHRLEAAKANKWEIYVATVPMKIEDTIVAMINSSQKAWSIEDFINFYAERGGEQYIFLAELMDEYNITAANLIALLKGGSAASLLKRGQLSFYSNKDEKKICIDLVEAYKEIRGHVSHQIYIDRDFVFAFRTIIQSIDVPTLAQRIETYNKAILPQVTTKDYLRVFEEVVNFHKLDKNHIRFF